MLLALPYSEDEVVVLLVSAVLAGLGWFLWYRGLGAGSRLGGDGGARRVLALAPAVALLLVFIVLRGWASFDVQDSPAYLFQYVLLGAAWLGGATTLVTWLGLSARDDVAERDNPAAAVALAGALLGLALCYAGGNVGDGPGWWVVVFASGLATAAFFAVWMLLEALAHPSDWITIDRDLAAGLRHAAFCVAQGLVLGGAAAGDWVSGADTLRDFAADGWPALVLLALAVVFERALGPSADVPRRSPVACGLVPGALHVLGAALWVALRGGWS
jgi:uncharacterized membrane protein YjfL (UPF0719 family)